MTVLKTNDWKNFIWRTKTAVALGSFDALHRGHIKVISEMLRYAKENGLLSVVQLVDIPCFRRINSDEKKIDILQKLGVDVVLYEDFSPEFKEVTYKKFVKDFIAEKYNAAAVFTGENYRFGYMAEGDTDKLAAECSYYDIRVFSVECLKFESVVSSTEIRNFIGQGKMEKVIEYMGRPFSVSGEVVHGRELGRTLGFPTTNINFPEGFAIPKDGVYLSKVLFDEMVFWGITNVGAKPTVHISEKNIETHISDYKGDLYGKTVEIQFLKKIRDIQKFESIEELKVQLKKDEKQAKSLVEHNDSNSIITTEEIGGNGL